MRQALHADGTRTDSRRLLELLEAYWVREQVRFDASVVRGLAYYTGVVFEAFDTGGKLRAICGGGRYDRLAETLGGPAIPAVGFGFGDMVIAELLREEKLWPEPARRVDDCVFAFGEEERPAAIRLAIPWLVTAAVVQIAESLFGACPRAFLLGIRASAFEPFNDPMTVEAESVLESALAFLRPLLAGDEPFPADSEI